MSTMSFESELTATSDIEPRKDLWERLIGLTGIFDARHCGEPCVVQPECIERCTVWDNEQTELCNNIANESDAVIPTSHASSAVLLSPEKVLQPKPPAEFTIRWANLQGMQGKAITEDGTTHHSLLPLTSSGLEAEGLTALPAPRFVSGIPIQAYLYKADPSDPIDVELQRNLQLLPTDVLNVLSLRRIQHGSIKRIQQGMYEIDGRQVRIYRGGAGSMQYLVHEEGVGSSGIADMPLRAYVNLVGNVATSLKRLGMSPTFADTASTAVNKIRDDSDDRYVAIRIACTQAELRDSGKYYGSLA